MMKQALYWKSCKKGNIQCTLCPHLCIIQENKIGKCKVRANKGGKLHSLVYGKPCSLAIDPIEKKPFYHFLPSSRSFSIATAGCNLRCLHCQNWEISQASPNDTLSKKASPEEIVQEALNNKCKSISYTYTEPIIFYEYMLDIAKLAKAKGLKNIIVSNGFINPEPLLELCKYIHAANIDLKAMSESHYKKICQGSLKPVLNTIKTLHKKGIWLELTNLLIPEKNDSEKQIKQLADYIKSISKNIPVHFSAFHPCYKMLNTPPTSLETLKRAREIALKTRLRYIYTGNLPDKQSTTTYCPKCKAALIERENFTATKNTIKKGQCSCKTSIPGIWE